MQAVATLTQEVEEGESELEELKEKESHIQPSSHLTQQISTLEVQQKCVLWRQNLSTEVK